MSGYRELWLYGYSLFGGTYIVNVLKFRTLYILTFLPKFCFSCSYFLKYLVKRQTMQTQEQSDLGLHCLHTPFYWALFFGVGNFRTFTIQ